MPPVSPPPNRGPLYPPEVGELVRSGLTPAAAWRRFLGLTAEEVAGKAEVDVFTYRRMEDRQCPGESERWMLASALGIWVAQLDTGRLATAADMVRPAGTTVAQPEKAQPHPLRLRE